MTPEQFDRWKDFAIRMAKTCFKRNRRPYSFEIVAHVEDFFADFEMRDVACIVDWDHSTDYPEGHPWYEKQFRAHCWNEACMGFRAEGCPYRCEDGRIFDYASAPLVCDICSGMEDVWVPSYWSIPEADEVPEAYEHARAQWAGPICGCIRAGLDMASAPSAGVLGFTAGDVRRMYPEGVPEWVFPPDERLRYWLSDRVNGAFQELPDDAELVL